MNISSDNKLDLLYLTNPLLLTKYNKTFTFQAKVSEEDKNFYRKRILVATKNYLRGESINNDIDKLFENFTIELINYFKFIDKKDIVQKEYENIEKKKTNPSRNFKIATQNEIIMKQKNTNKTILDYLPVVVKKNKNTNKKIIMPKQKKFDLKNPILREKGL